MKKTLIMISLLLLITAVFNVQASKYDQANWYVTVDVEQFKAKVLPLLPKSSKNDANFSIKDNLPDEIQQFTFYGNSEVENDMSIAISGDFAAFSLNEYITELMYTIDEESPVSLSETSGYNGHNIEHYTISDHDKNKSFFSTKVSSDLVVLSFEKAEVQNWIDDKYDSNELHHSGLVSVLVNIESAMAHMGADLKSNKKAFNSAVFQKITQFSASVIDAGDNLAIESALSTADEATAKQLEQVLNGLIAMNALSDLGNENPLLSAVVSSLSISNQGSELLLSTEFALSLIPQIDVD